MVDTFTRPIQLDTAFLEQFKTKIEYYKNYIDLVVRSATKTGKFKNNNNKEKYLDFLLTGYGTKDYMPACSAVIRLVAGEKLASFMTHKYLSEIQPRGQQLYHLTLALPEHRTGDRHCEIDIPRMRKVLWNIMRQISPDYIGFFEIDVTVNQKCVSDAENRGRDTVFHAHILFWTNKKIQPNVLSKKLSEKLGQHKDGIKTAVVNRCKDTAEDVYKLTSYLIKTPSAGKTKVYRKTRNADGELIKLEERRKPVGKGARPIIVSRQAEIMSHLDMRNLFTSGGEGKEIKDYIIKALVMEAEMHQRYAPEGFGYEKIRSFWRMMRKHGWGKAYPEPKIIARAPAKRSSK